jgi:hypothetical protein
MTIEGGEVEIESKFVIGHHVWMIEDCAYMHHVEGVSRARHFAVHNIAQAFLEIFLTASGIAMHIL